MLGNQVEGSSNDSTGAGAGTSATPAIVSPPATFEGNESNTAQLIDVPGVAVFERQEELGPVIGLVQVCYVVCICMYMCVFVCVCYVVCRVCVCTCMCVRVCVHVCVCDVVVVAVCVHVYVSFCFVVLCTYVVM